MSAQGSPAGPVNPSSVASWGSMGPALAICRDVHRLALADTAGTSQSDLIRLMAQSQTSRPDPLSPSLSPAGAHVRPFTRPPNSTSPGAASRLPSPHSAARAQPPPGRPGVGEPWEPHRRHVGALWETGCRAGLSELVGQPAGLPNLSYSQSEADHDGEGSPGHGVGAAAHTARGRLRPVPVGAPASESFVLDNLAL